MINGTAILDKSLSEINLLKQLVDSYFMPKQAKNILTNSDLLVICGVTAAGKNTIVNHLIEFDNYEHVVSHTTRRPRYNHGQLEQNGQDYWFVSDQEMLSLVEKRAFIEIKAVHGDTFYGTSINAVKNVLKHKKHPVLEIDIQGAIELATVANSLNPVFVIPPSYDVWMERLNNRGHMDSHEKSRRLSSAKTELKIALNTQLDLSNILSPTDQVSLDKNSFSVLDIPTTDTSVSDKTVFARTDSVLEQAIVGQSSKLFTIIVNHDVKQTALEITGGIDNSIKEQSKRGQLAQSLLDKL